MARDSDFEPPRSPSPAPPLWCALIPVVALVALIYLSVVVFETTAHIALILATVVAASVGKLGGRRWTDIEAGMIQGVIVGLKPILILLVIGMLIATWIAGGIVPLMIYHGLELLNPSIFLAAACLICGAVSIATGSSWTTAGTVGVALMGVGQGLGVSEAMTAGAVVSGAYFGDKLSPLSDTTNLAPAVAGSDLFEHIRYMLHTTVPAMLIALILYLFLGRGTGGDQVAGEIEAIRAGIAGHYDLNGLLWLAPLLVVVMVLFKWPALPALLGGAALGGAFAGLVQDVPLDRIFIVAYDGFISETGNATIDDLLSRGGLSSMMSTVALILCALTLGGVMEHTGMLATLARALLKLARGTGSLVATTACTCFGMNALAPDQYLSIIIPGRMYKAAYEQHGLEHRLLSRTLEDAGTLSSPLIPWNTCGAFMGQTLGVGAFAFAPFAFVNLLTPVIAIVIATAGWGIIRSGRRN